MPDAAVLQFMLSLFVVSRLGAYPTPAKEKAAA
jgi:hypothetical protein